VTQQTYKVLLEWSESDQVWLVFVPALNGMSTFGETRAEALRNAEESITGYLEALLKDGQPLPSPSEFTEVVDLQVTLP
jgi:predicted RNase H-like HicB family nuclease